MLSPHDYCRILLSCTAVFKDQKSKRVMEAEQCFCFFYFAEMNVHLLIRNLY